ncbi:DDE_3 domain-containing protein [Trichonephila clavipes]|nr:DDE_3 domain-containing protein [Trichonephila clavipes]
MDSTCQQGTVQAGVGSVRVWGVCSSGDMEPLIRLDMALIDEMYINILFDHLHPFMSIMHSDGFREFQQDNATTHTSRIATEWLQKYSSEIRHFRSPPKSPYMNIIEDIRGALQRAVKKRSSPPLNSTYL